MNLTHLDGADAVVYDDRGQQVPVVSVCVEPGLAVVTVDIGAWSWLRALQQRNPAETLSGEVYSANGHQHHRGALRLVLCA